MRFAFIEQHAAAYPVRLMCRVLEVSPSGYYAWRARPESPRDVANRQLVAKIRRIEVHHHGRYGSPRMHAALRAQGHRCSRGRVERLMRRHRIRALAGRRYRPCTTDSRHYMAVAPNLLARAASRHSRRTASGSPTSPTSRPARAGSTSLPSSISPRGRSSAGPCATTCALSWHCRR